MSASAQTIIDDDFDDGVVTGWIGQGNTRTISAHVIEESGSVLVSRVVPTQADTHRGIVSETAFDPTSVPGGFTITFVVKSQSTDEPGANGFFIGIVSEGNDFFRNLPNFGLTFFGIDSRTGSDGGFGIVYGDRNGTLPADFIFGTSDAQGDVQLASFQDGFTAEVTADAKGWSYEITGLNTLAGTPAVFTDSGTWAAAGTTLVGLFGSDSSWHVMMSNQGPGLAAGLPEHTVELDRITLAAAAGVPFEITSADYDLDSIDPGVLLRWRSAAGERYSVDYSTDLSFWSEIIDDYASQGNETEFDHRFLPNDAHLIGAERLFYRIRR